MRVVPCRYLALVLAIVGFSSVHHLGCKKAPPSTASPIYTLPEGVLEIHLLASRTTMGAEVRDAQVKAFVDGGPAKNEAQQLTWFEVAPSVTISGENDAVVAKKTGRTFILARVDEAGSLDQRTKFVVHFADLKRYPESQFGPSLTFFFDEPGARRLRDMSGKHVLAQLGIFLDGQLHSFATIMEELPGDSIQLSGRTEHMETLHSELVRRSAGP